MKKQNQAVKLSGNQSGMAAILITMIMMIVVSLIVLGLSTVSRHEQQDALDRQLNTAAFYAAESGVNEAMGAINVGKYPLARGASYVDTPKTTCGDEGFFHYNLGSNTEITCLLINPHPEQLVYQNVGLQTPVISPLQFLNGGGNPGTAQNIVVTWQDQTGDQNSFTGCPSNFPTSWPANCDAGVLRLDLVEAGKNGDLTRAGLQTNTMSVFLRPQNGGGGGTVSYSTGNNGQIVDAPCTASPPSGRLACSVSITGPFNTNNQPYYIRIQSIYDTPQNIIITPYDGANHKLELENGQVVIDATGKADGTLRRIQVAIPLSALPKYQASFPVQSGGSVCKRFTTLGPGNGANPGWNGLPLAGDDTSACWP